MFTGDIVVLLLGAALIIFILWFFFGEKEKGEAIMVNGNGGKQRLTIVVEGAYSPSLVTVKKGVPVEITFDRRETGDCSEWVIFGKSKVKSQKSKVEEKEIKAHLEPYAKTKVEFTPMEAGEVSFSCGMGMLHGKLVVKE